MWEKLHNEELELVVVRYYGVDIDFAIASHGNSSKSNRPFFRSPASSIEDLKGETGVPKTLYMKQVMSGEQWLKYLLLFVKSIII